MNDLVRQLLGALAVELAEYDDITRTVRYTHPEWNAGRRGACNQLRVVVRCGVPARLTSIDDCY